MTCCVSGLLDESQLTVGEIGGGCEIDGRHVRGVLSLIQCRAVVVARLIVHSIVFNNVLV